MSGCYSKDEGFPQYEDGEKADGREPAAEAPQEPTQEPTVGQRYGRLVDEKDRLKSALAVVESGIASLNDQVIEWMQQGGVNHVRLDTGRTLTIKKDIWPKMAFGTERSDVIAALEAAGLSDMVSPSYNANTLAAFVRECVREGRPLPDAFAGRIEISEVLKVGTRRPSVSVNEVNGRGSDPEEE